jgi:hypothetical protein
VVSGLAQKRVEEIDSDAECYICLATFELDEHVRRLPCGHEFHAECVDR